MRTEFCGLKNDSGVPDGFFASLSEFFLHDVIAAGMSDQHAAGCPHSPGGGDGSGGSGRTAGILFFQRDRYDLPTVHLKGLADELHIIDLKGPV